MSALVLIHAAPDAAVYALSEVDAASSVERLVVSTEASRAICNRPEILGVAYTRGLQRAVTQALATPPLRDALRAYPEERFCVLHLLRGGLNFGLRDALCDAYGFQRHGSAFLSSQRYFARGAWHVREDAYRKLPLPDEAVLVLGDVVATGATLRHGLETLLRHLQESGKRLSRLVCFTIGCEVLEQTLDDVDETIRRMSPDFAGSTAVYLEGRFALAGDDTGLRIVQSGTDLLRRDALLAPEFIASQFDAVTHPLERCAIYDAGSRAFDIPAYLQDVRDYWRHVAALARDGFTLSAALAERWTTDLPARWSPPGRFALDSTAALSAVCEERLTTLGHR